MRFAQTLIALLMLGLFTHLPLSMAEESPKEILQATPDKLKEGVDQIKHGFKKGTATRKADREKVKQDIKTKNPVTQAPKPARQ
jgi:predicted Co/Zn/Cd cation transporter (cation efflux family)